ncbi:serine hydrolase [Nocardioides mesophilus]|uniref:Serine hydrolase n=1 Tax=Nocardioides mesophilus TaxID=433659 RepID=A0A7G9RBE5_9ACTN|nr:serine hydrolase [Nocardioides mesophilus]QNN52920.1 serine hydrolase [Nocardioides mesophilus]
MPDQPDLPESAAASLLPTLPAELGAAVRECADDLVAASPQRTGTVSVWLGDLDLAVHLSHDADAEHYAASTMKLPLLLAAYRRHEDGSLDLDAEVPVHNRFASAADGTAYSLDRDDDQDDETWELVGGRSSLRRLAEHATVRSGNLATNLLLEHVGAGAVASVLSDAGCSSSTTLLRGIEDAVAREAGLDNVVTAADLGQVLRGIGNRSLAQPATCVAVEEVLSRQTYRDGIPAGVPAGTPVANKTGWVEGVSHDVALVRPERRPAYVLVVLTSVDVPEETATEAIADISALVWEGWHR